MSLGHAARRADLSDEEWEALRRLARGAPEARLVPSVLVGILAEAGLVEQRRAGPRLSEAGRRLILRHKHDP